LTVCGSPKSHRIILYHIFQEWPPFFWIFSNFFVIVRCFKSIFFLQKIDIFYIFTFTYTAIIFFRMVLVGIYKNIKSPLSNLLLKNWTEKHSFVSRRFSSINSLKWNNSTRIIFPFINLPGRIFWFFSVKFNCHRILCLTFSTHTSRQIFFGGQLCRVYLLIFKRNIVFALFYRRRLLQLINSYLVKTNWISQQMEAKLIPIRRRR